MNKINKDWHLKNRMPKNATEEQRAQWHFAHAKNCQCRVPSGKVIELIKKYYPAVSIYPTPRTHYKTQP